MKKYLITILTTLSIVPTTGSMISQSSIFMKSNNKSLIQNTNSIRTTSNSLEGLNWNYIQDSVDEAIDNPKKMLSMLDSNILQSEDLSELTQEQKSYAKSQTKKYIDTFKAKGFNKSTQVTSYLQTENTDFKEYYNNPETGVETTEAKILFEYFINKIDLNLYNYNTYENVIDHLKQEILLKYSNIDLKIMLADSTLRTKYLLDETKQDNIINFINNNIVIPIKIQINNGQIIEENIRLKNIKIKIPANRFDLPSPVLFKVVEFYFSKENPQNLNLQFTDTYQTVFERIKEKINKRFPGIWNVFNLQESLTPWRTFSDIENRKRIFNEDFSIDFKFNYSKYFSLYLDFDFNEEVHWFLNDFYINNCLNNPNYFAQDLRLTTDNTFQDVIERLNQRLARLFSSNVVAYLANPNEGQTKLQKQYRGQDNQFFHLNLGFKIIDSERNILKEDLGITNLVLENVSLGQEAQEVKKAFNDLQELINQIEFFSAISQTTIIALDIAAAAFWAVAWFFGISTAWAIACTITSIALGTAVAGMSIAITNYKQKIANLWEAGMLIWSINRLGLGLGLIIKQIVVNVTTVLTATSWANFGLIFTVLGIFTTAYAWINYYLDTHK